jgi:hypothetical protein
MSNFYKQLNLQIDEMLKSKYQFATNQTDGVQLLHDISKDINEIVETMLKEQSSQISDKAVRWLRNVLFVKVSISDGLSISDLVVVNNYDLSDLTDHDLFMFSSLLESSEFKNNITKEIKSRKNVSN